jgi:hypothetical protein
MYHTPLKPTGAFSGRGEAEGTWRVFCPICVYRRRIIFQYSFRIDVVLSTPFMIFVF